MYIRVSVIAGAKKENVVQKDDTTFHIFVKEPAERNMANTRIREILAIHYGIALGKVQILTGHRSPSKIFSVDV